LAAEEGVLFPDHVVRVGTSGSRRAAERALVDLPPGVTEVYFHPAADSGELRSLAPDWSARVDDLDALTSPGGITALAARAGVRLIGYRELRDVQRDLQRRGDLPAT